MKKSKITFLCLLSASSVLALAGLNGFKSYHVANASLKNVVRIEDDFNNGAFANSIDPNKWVGSSSRIAQGSEGASYLHVEDTFTGCERMVFVTKEKLANIQSVSFDFKYDGECNRWFSPQFIENFDKVFTDYAYEGFGNVKSTSFESWGGLKNFSGINFTNIVGTTAVGTYLTCQIDITSSSQASINVRKQGEAFDSTKSVTCENKHSDDLQNCYFALAVSHDAGGISFDNIKIVTAERTIEEDFSAEDLTNSDFTYAYSVEAYADRNKYEIIHDNKLQFVNAEVGDYIYSVASIIDQTSGVSDINAIDMTMDIKVTEGYKLGIVFGLNKDDVTLNKSTAVYETDYKTGILKEYDAEGTQTTEDASNTNKFVKKIYDGINLGISINKESGVTITENGAKVKYSLKEVNFSKLSNIYGSIGFVVLAKGEGECYIDNLKVNNNEYFVPTTKTVTHDFSNNYFGNEEKGELDFYLRDPKDANPTTVENGRLCWNGATDGTFFGSAYQYDDFTLEFKIMSIYGDGTLNDSAANKKEITVGNKWIGVDFSRSNMSEPGYGSYGTFMTQITKANPTDECSANIWKLDDSPTGLDYNAVKQTQINKVYASYFQDITYKDAALKGNIKESDAVCMKYEMKNGTLTFSMKKNSERVYTEYTKVEGLESNGYVVICCTGYTFLEIDDFVMTNTSDYYNLAPTYTPETIVDEKETIIYDNGNVDVNLQEEIRINSSNGCKGSVVATLSTLVIAGIGLVTTAILRKNKREE